MYICVYVYINVCVCIYKCVCAYLYAASLYTGAFTQLVPQILGRGTGLHSNKKLLGLLVRVLPEKHYRDDLRVEVL